jgi:hypothetical protein
MKVKILLASVLILIALVAVIIPQVIRQLSANLTGYEEVPAVSTVASGEFTAQILNEPDPNVIGGGGVPMIRYQLSYRDLEGAVTQSHIHFGQPGVNGGISVWLCGTPALNPPPGTPLCPDPPATVTGTIVASNVVGPAAQGIAPGEFVELIRAIRAGRTYANVHSTKFPGGEIRNQIDPDNVHNHLGNGTLR